ncbi:helix-turn-helix domain-containing protein [Polaribacter sp.]|nr:helix-turn-helix domain-containing protein [Polaribacter sp.]
MIQVIDRAFNILEFIASQEEKYITLTKISIGVGLHKATCSNIIKTMVKRNYLEKSEDSKGYKLGFMFLTLSGDKNDLLPYTLKAKGPLKKLRDDLQEGCLLAVIRGKMRINVYKTNTTKELRIVILDEKSAYQTASGRVLLSCFTKSQINKYIEEFGLPSKEEWPEVKSIKSLFSNLEKIKTNGFCLRESPEGILGYAVAIIGPNNLIFSLSVFLPNLRWNDKTEKKIKEQVTYTSNIVKKAFLDS